MCVFFIWYFKLRGGTLLHIWKIFSKIPKDFCELSSETLYIRIKNKMETSSPSLRLSSKPLFVIKQKSKTVYRGVSRKLKTQIVIKSFSSWSFKNLQYIQSLFLCLPFHMRWITFIIHFWKFYFCLKLVNHKSTKSWR